MAGYGYLRYMIDLAVPLDKEGDLPPGLQGQLNAIKQHINFFKSWSEKVNSGEPEEDI